MMEKICFALKLQRLSFWAGPWNISVTLKYERIQSVPHTWQH